MTARVQPDLSILLRRHHAAGKGVSYLARHFGLSRQTVNNIIRFKTHAKVVDIGQPLEVFDTIKTKPRAKSTPAPPAPDNTLLDLVSRYKSTPAPAAPPAPTPPGPRPGDVQPSPTPPDTRRELEPDVQPDPETWATSAAGVYHTGTEALDVQPGPVDVQPDPEPDPPPTDPESWGAKPFEPRRRGRR